MKYVVAYVRAGLLMVHTGLHMAGLFIHSILSRGDKVALGFKYRRLWGRRAYKLLGIKIINEPSIYQGPPALFISNHRTLTDPIVQVAFIDSYIIAKSEVGHIPVVGKGAEMTGIIFVDRTSLKSRNGARLKTEDLLISGKSVLVYPEGTTTIERKSGRFKIGTFRVAAEHNIPVVPMAIEYRDSKDYWLNDSLTKQMIDQVGPPSSYVKIRIGPPLQSDDATTLLKMTQEWIDNSLAEMQEGWSRVFV